MRLFFLLPLILVLLASCSDKSCTSALIPVEDFFKNPDKAYYKLSPDGMQLSYLAPYESRMNVFVRNLATDSVRQLTYITDRDIVQYGWAGNNSIYFLKDIDGDENYYLSIIHLKDGLVREMTRFNGVRTEIVDELNFDEEEMLLSLNRRNPQIFDVYRLHLSTGELSLELENPGNYSSFLTDETGLIRLVTTTDGTNNGFLYRAAKEEGFKNVLEVDFKNSFQPVAFVAGSSHLVYALSNLNRDKTAAVLYDLTAGKEVEVIFEHPKFDADWLIMSEKTKKPLMVHYTDWKSRYHFLDERVKSLHNLLRKTIPEDEITFTGADESENKVIVRTFSDKTMGAYYLFNTQSEELELLAEVSPWLDKKQMAAVQPIQYLSRDGLQIHGYLTIPNGLDPKNLPVVVMPHGGPWMRDVWRFDRNVQFLANRGYAVFQMNFRGSTGYGRAFWEASFKQWGKNMQNDITDGVQYLIDQGIANPKRIAIYGSSYGGYAVLAGLAFTPDLYACGIDYVGVSNLFTLMQTIPPYWEPGRQMFYEMIGHPQSDSMHYVQASPIFHADKIKVPLMVVQGAMDPRVKKSEADQIVEALAARGVEVDYILREDEGHGFYKQENRIALYEAIEVFLSRHLTQ
ncbi:MAG: S9 family peptidase [Sphingobacteriaceae bacterium]|nr:S9 family peptidase [Sphingobacteriaceae bacterium]